MTSVRITNRFVQPARPRSEAHRWIRPRKRGVALVHCLLLSGTILSWAPAFAVQHFVFFNRERERIHGAPFLGSSAITGAQIKYTWRELEPERDRYDFSAIRADLAFLRANGKALFIQLQDVTFDRKFKCIPRYLLVDPEFHGGADRQYNIEGDDEQHATVQGWVARRWDPAVRSRFHKLLLALGKEFDGRIVGINLPETAVDFGETGRLYPRGFSPTNYRDTIVANLEALKRAFPRSVKIQYANFMPGDSSGMEERSYLHSIYEHARVLKVGVGGPDLLPYRRGQMRNSYPLMRDSHGIVPVAIAVQDGNYATRSPHTGRPVTIQELLDFATGYLKVDYIFWCTQEPYYSRDLLPFLARAQK